MSFSRLALASLLLTAFIVAGCSSNGAVKAPAANDNTVVAEINGDTITLADLDERIAGELYEVRSNALEELIRERVFESEAESRGVSVEQLLETEAAAVGEVSDEEVAAFFEENRARMRPDETLENIAPQIRAFLSRDLQQQAMRNLLDAASVVRHLEPPRLEIAATGPSIGPDDAPVTIIEFSDYQCPFCSRAEPIVKQVLERYPDQVRLVYRHLPLDSIHPQARPAAIAAVCASRQEKFWEFHEGLFANQRSLGAEVFGNLADELELDRAVFDACLTNPEAAAIVAADSEAGAAAGVTGTPAFFVNGIKLSGAVPVEDFVEVIEAELAAEGGA